MFLLPVRSAPSRPACVQMRPVRLLESLRYPRRNHIRRAGNARRDFECWFICETRCVSGSMASAACPKISSGQNTRLTRLIVCSFSHEGPYTYLVLPWTVLPRVPNKSNTGLEPPLQLSPATRRKSTYVFLSNLFPFNIQKPHRQDPEYARMSELLPEYRASLEARYPQICTSCLPSVEEEIKRRDNSTLR